MPFAVDTMNRSRACNLKQITGSKIREGEPRPSVAQHIAQGVEVVVAGKIGNVKHACLVDRHESCRTAAMRNVGFDVPVLAAGACGDEKRVSPCDEGSRRVINGVGC